MLKNRVIFCKNPIYYFRAVAICLVIDRESNFIQIDTHDLQAVNIVTTTVKMG